MFFHKILSIIQIIIQSHFPQRHPIQNLKAWLIPQQPNNKPYFVIIEMLQNKLGQNKMKLVR